MCCAILPTLWSGLLWSGLVCAQGFITSTSPRCTVRHVPSLPLPSLNFSFHCLSLYLYIFPLPYSLRWSRACLHKEMGKEETKKAENALQAALLSRLPASSNLPLSVRDHKRLFTMMFCEDVKVTQRQSFAKTGYRQTYVVYGWVFIDGSFVWELIR